MNTENNENTIGTETTAPAPTPKPMTRGERKTAEEAIAAASFIPKDEDEKKAEPVLVPAKIKRTLLTEISCFTPAGASSLMASRGLAYVKRTGRDEQGREVPEIIEIPITTATLDNIRKQMLDAQRPIPPKKMKSIHPSSDMGKSLGITETKIVEVAIWDDPKYTAAMELFTNKLTKAMVAEAIDIPLYYQAKGEQRVVAQTNAEKIVALDQAGFTEPQYQQVAEAVGRISSWSDEEKRNFFGLVLG